MDHAVQEVQAAAATNYADLAETYIKLRDYADQIMTAAKAKVATIELGMEKIEAEFLRHFIETGAESMKTAAGTAYKKRAEFITVKDKALFLSHIQNNGAWELLTIAANKAMALKYIEDNEMPPPGVNYTAKDVVQVRRS